MQSLQWDSILDRMAATRRFLNLKVIVLIATILFVVIGYLAFRRVTGSGLEPGMDKAALVAQLGEPTSVIGFFGELGAMWSWSRTLINGSIYSQMITVKLNGEDKAFHIQIDNTVFGYKFSSSKESR